jgi:integrase
MILLPPSSESVDTNKVDPKVIAIDILRHLVALLHRSLNDYAAAGRPEHDPVAVVRTQRSVSPLGPTRKTLAALVDELLLAKKADGLSTRYIGTIRGHLNRFAAAFNEEIHSITATQIEEWLRALPVGPRARNNIRASVVTLFRFAQKHGFLPKGQLTEADDVAKAKDRGGKIGTLNPADLAMLVDKAPEKIRLFLTLGAFTGMRTSEMLRLEWHDVNFDRAFITVSPEKAKTATRRLVPILPNMMQWLAPYRGKVGSIFRTRRDADAAIAYAKACNVGWPNNALRHSYATYRLAATANAARVALEMGNSPQKLMRNYRELADQQEAEAWFAISPQSPPNVISVGTV